MSDIERIDINETAKIIRKELKAAFPDIAFSVRCKKYSMGCHIDVDYHDGPPTRAIEAITDQYYGTGFDGMTDSTTYHNSEFQGRNVRFQGSRPSVSRSITDETSLLSRVKAALAAYNLENRSHYSLEWNVLSSMDLRWETPERAVVRCVMTDRIFV